MTEINELLELSEQLKGKKVIFKGNAFIAISEATIIDIKASMANDIILTIQANNTESKIMLSAILDGRWQVLDADPAFMNSLQESYLKVHAAAQTAELEKFQAEQAERKAKKEEERKIIEAKKLEAKKSSLDKSLLLKANNLSEGNYKISKTDEYFVSLGYVAKHVKKISVSFPDTLQNWFDAEFGQQECRVIDSTKVGSSGFTSQWSISMQIDLDTNENMPAYLLPYLSETKKVIKPISKLDFIFDIIKKYGFVFGKKQNLDQILNTIPAEQLDNFNLGYNLI